MLKKEFFSGIKHEIQFLKGGWGGGGAQWGRIECFIIGSSKVDACNFLCSTTVHAITWYIWISKNYLNYVDACILIAQYFWFIHTVGRGEMSNENYTTKNILGRVGGLNSYSIAKPLFWRSKK